MKINSPQKKLLLYFFATFLFSWLFWVPSAIMFRNSDSLAKLVQSPVFIALQTLGAAGPSLVAIIFLKLDKRSGEMKALVNRYKQWRFDKKWYFSSVLLFPLLALLALILHAMFMAPIPNEHPLLDLYG